MVLAVLAVLVFQRVRVQVWRLLTAQQAKTVAQAQRTVQAVAVETAPQGQTVRRVLAVMVVQVQT
jgi:hypothetical protein